ncbi:MAG: hypothetical protein FWF40_01200 [Methanomassiliicoccaceae archaeon]|nr:hypothetical protein [Methanomassiliicoccaceae archaeon]
MNKIIPILIVALLASSAVFIFTSSDASGASEERTYTDALLPDVYRTDISSGSYANIQYTGQYNYFPATYRMYTPGTAANIDSYLDTGYLPASDYVSGPGVLFVFAYRPPAELRVEVSGTQIDSNTLVLVREGVSFQFYSGQPVTITLYGTIPPYMYFGLGDWNYKPLEQETNEFTISAPGEWRIYVNGYPTPVFFTFTIEYEEMPENTETYGYLMLALAAICIGILAASAKKRKIKG